jgi:hypothetical protein
MYFLVQCWWNMIFRNRFVHFILDNVYFWCNIGEIWYLGIGLNTLFWTVTIFGVM